LGLDHPIYESIGEMLLSVNVIPTLLRLSPCNQEGHYHRHVCWTCKMLPRCLSWLDKEFNIQGNTGDLDFYDAITLKIMEKIL